MPVWHKDILNLSCSQSVSFKSCFFFFFNLRMMFELQKSVKCHGNFQYTFFQLVSIWTFYDIMILRKFVQLRTLLLIKLQFGLDFTSTLLFLLLILSSPSSSPFLSLAVLGFNAPSKIACHLSLLMHPFLRVGKHEEGWHKSWVAICDQVGD